MKAWPRKRTASSNYEHPDPDCPIDYVTKGSVKKNIDVALTNSFGFGGGNACLVVKKFHP